MPRVAPEMAMLHGGCVSRLRISRCVDRLNASFGLFIVSLYCLFFSCLLDVRTANLRCELGLF